MGSSTACRRLDTRPPRLCDYSLSFPGLPLMYPGPPQSSHSLSTRSFTQLPKVAPIAGAGGPPLPQAWWLGRRHARGCLWLCTRETPQAQLLARGDWPVVSESESRIESVKAYETCVR